MIGLRFVLSFNLVKVSAEKIERACLEIEDSPLIFDWTGDFSRGDFDSSLIFESIGDFNGDLFLERTFSLDSGDFGGSMAGDLDGVC